MILSIYIINKAGGLIFQSDFAKMTGKRSANDYLVLAGTFHGFGSLLRSVFVDVHRRPCLLASMRLQQRSRPRLVRAA